MPEIEAPVVGVTFDTDDIPGSLMNVVMGVVGVAMSLGIIAAGRSLWNSTSEQTDAVGEVEFL